MRPGNALVTFLAVTFACLLSAGCYNAEEVKGFLLKPRAPVSGVEYRVLPPDVILISSLYVPEINDRAQTVRPDGKINLPLLGEIDVAGRTPKQIERAIMLAAKPYYEKVDATVEVVGYNSQKYFIFGQVRRPGPMPWTGHDTLLGALASAQPTFLAWPERIRVVRGLEPREGGRLAEQTFKYARKGIHPHEKDKKPDVMTVNLMAMIKSGDLSNNILLKPNDVIYVQPNPLAKIGLAIQMLLFPIRPAAETVSVPARAATAVGGP